MAQQHLPRSLPIRLHRCISISSSPARSHPQSLRSFTRTIHTPTQRLSQLCLSHPRLSFPRTTAISIQSQCRTFTSSTTRAMPVEAPETLNEQERAIFEKLKGELEPSSLEVADISGGCGSMYSLDIASSKFEGLSVVKQHKLVNAVLKEEIAGWHGVQLKTRAS